MAGECVRQSLQRGIRVASESRHYSDQDHTLGQADDQSREREAHHTAHVDPSRAKVVNQMAHDQGEEGWGSTLQEQAQTTHTDAWKKDKNIFTATVTKQSFYGHKEAFTAGNPDAVLTALSWAKFSLFCLLHAIKRL